MRLRPQVIKYTENTRYAIPEVADGRIVAYTSHPLPTWVEIVPDKDGFFLFHLDQDEECVADTLHFSVDEAKRQAEFQYGITSDEWFEVRETK